MDLRSWQSQVRKGAAELVVLGLLRRRELYGSELLDRARVGADLLSDGSLYPLLGRLEREGKLASRWSVARSGGHPRKYYRLTDDGAARFEAMYAAWNAFSAAVTRSIEEADDDDQASGPRRAFP
jgi:PadR family transcriptional regulator PadR